MYALLAAIFALSIVIGLLLVLGFILKPHVWHKNLRRIKIFCLFWFVPYFAFILFFTGPEDLNQYPPHELSPYKLPWRVGVTRILSQGNRSFTSHRGLHFYAWDFVMSIGTEVLAARDGVIVEVEQSFSTIGLQGNYVLVGHVDGQISGYFHIQHNGALVKVGEKVKRGQPIALSGMTGQTTLPHLHFLVFNSDQTASVPISFQEVDSGVPLAGHFYTSKNESP
ncbi:MAG: M23 family metallopeptidase [Pseudobdellovibrionaceae bacterium]